MKAIYIDGHGGNEVADHELLHRFIARKGIIIMCRQKHEIGGGQGHVDGDRGGEAPVDREHGGLRKSAEGEGLLGLGQHQQLFAAMLRISEIESLQVRGAFKSVDLTELVERVGEAFPRQTDKGRSRVVRDIARRRFDGGQQRGHGPGP